MRHGVGMLAVALAAAACTQAPSARQVVDEAADALGGADRVLAVETLVLEGDGTDWAVGGGVTPDAPPNSYLVEDYRLALNLADGQSRLQQVRTAQFPFALAVVARQDMRLDGDVAFNVGVGFGESADAPARATRVGDDAVRDRRRQLLQHPLAVVRAALQEGATIENLRDEHGQPHVDVITAAGDAVTLGVDPATGLPSHVEYLGYDPNWGDIVLEARFEDYGEVDGLMVPATVVTLQDEWTTSTRAVSTTINGDTGGLEAPAEVSAAPMPTAAPPPAEVPVEQVAEGIWWLTGSSHRSVVFEFDDHLMLFEVPLNEARALAVIETARTLSDKPLTHVLVSHHHLDHAGGVRAAIAEGLTLVTHRGNEAFFREIAARPHTLQQDALARAPREPMFQLVDDTLTIADGSLDLRLYHALGVSHMETALFVWVPRDRMLVQADLFDNGWFWHPWGSGFLENLETRGLDVATHVPIHGPRQTHAEVLATLRAMPAGPPTQAGS
jgi:glyoxylase-like metal-dependent hydrolase (beta-lactamase superfamily II)